jgi:hypothetical protein
MQVALSVGAFEIRGHEIQRPHPLRAAKDGPPRIAPPGAARLSLSLLPGEWLQWYHHRVPAEQNRIGGKAEPPAPTALIRGEVTVDGATFGFKGRVVDGVARVNMFNMPRP